MNFASDNTAGIAPEILAAIAGANTGAALAYGQDAWTNRVERDLPRFSSTRSRSSWCRPAPPPMRWRSPI